MQVNLWASLGYGLMLLLVPDVFCDLLRAEAVNTAWLRGTRSEPRLIGTNVVGSWLWLGPPGMDLEQGAVRHRRPRSRGDGHPRWSMDEFTLRTSGWSRRRTSMAIVDRHRRALPDHVRREMYEPGVSTSLPCGLHAPLW